MTTVAPAAPATPIAAPLRTVAPAAPQAPVAPAAPQIQAAPPAADAASTPAPPVPETGDLAALIAASPDPAAELIHLVHAVAARSANAAIQGRILHAVKYEAGKTLEAVRTSLLASVIDSDNPNGKPGVYQGFTVTVSAGSRKLSYEALKEEHPDVYDELVTVGAPSLNVKYTG